MIPVSVASASISAVVVIQVIPIQAIQPKPQLTRIFGLGCRCLCVEADSVERCMHAVRLPLFWAFLSLLSASICLCLHSACTL